MPKGTTAQYLVVIKTLGTICWKFPRLCKLNKKTQILVAYKRKSASNTKPFAITVYYKNEIMSTTIFLYVKCYVNLLC